MNYWFTADHHFAHPGALKWRPQFKDLEAMDAMLWRSLSCVQPGDCLFHLGDVAWTTGGLETFFEALAREVRVVLIFGNHDWRCWAYRDRKKWDRLIDPKSPELFYDPMLEEEVPVSRFFRTYDQFYINWKFDEVRRQIMLNHYPMASWRCSFHGSWHLHGHSHGSYQPERGKILDVGVDTRLALMDEEERADLFADGDEGRMAALMAPWGLGEIAAYMEGRELHHEGSRFE